MATLDGDDVFLAGKVRAQVEVFAENPDVSLPASGGGLHGFRGQCRHSHAGFQFGADPVNGGEIWLPRETLSPRRAA